MSRYPITPNTKISRDPHRGAYDESTIFSILDEAIDITISYIENGIPMAIPTGFVRVKDKIYIHGSVKSHFIKAICKTEKVCMTVSLLDGLVLANTAFNHSFNYRSVVAFSTPYLEADPAIKMEVFKAFTEKILPGRWDDNIRLPTPDDVKITALVCLPIEEASAKMRTGQPNNPQAEKERLVWTGHVPLKRIYQAPISSPDIPESVAMPKYLEDFVEKASAEVSIS